MNVITFISNFVPLNFNVHSSSVCMRMRMRTCLRVCVNSTFSSVGLYHDLRTQKGSQGNNRKYNSALQKIMRNVSNFAAEDAALNL